MKRMEERGWRREDGGERIEISESVRVGMLIAEHPLDRSGRAALPHPAPILG
jgi:hypothetical protein